MTETPTRAQLAGILAVHVDHLTAAIRANASIGLPDDEIGMERSAELLGLHKRNLLADEQPAGVRLLLDVMLAALAKQYEAAVSSAPADRAALVEGVSAALEHDSVRCPLCPDRLVLHTPDGARAHFTVVHPEQQITGPGVGPWPMLVDRAELRDRIAAAIHVDLTAHKARRDQGLLGIVPRLADAVLAVLPASADRAGVLREAARHLYTALFPAVYADMGQKAAEGVNRAVSELRRMADETPQPETEASQAPVQCTAAVLRKPHGPHGWEPQPGMTPVRCPGFCCCDHPDDEHSVYGCADGCACEYLPSHPAVGAQQPKEA